MEPDEKIIREFTFTADEDADIPKSFEGKAHLIVTNKRLRMDIPDLEDVEKLMKDEEFEDMPKVGEVFTKSIVKRIDNWLLKGIPLKNIKSYSYRKGKFYLKAKFIKIIPPFEADFELPEDIGYELVEALNEAFDIT